MSVLAREGHCTAGEKSVMPEGFESIGGEGLADLLEYIGQSKVKH